MDEIGIFFAYNGLVVQLPVNPPKLEVKTSLDSKKVEIVSLGQINLLKGRKLSSISFSSFFPETIWFSGVRTKGEFIKPAVYKKFFQGIMDDSKPCRLVVTGINLNMLVSVDDFNFYHQAGDHEDAYYSLALTEYRSVEMQTVSLGAATGTTAVLSQTTQTREASQITVGSFVLLNGQVFKDSYGGGPGKTFSNYSGKISLINKKGSCPYHVVSQTGSALGWVRAEAVKLK